MVQVKLSLEKKHSKLAKGKPVQLKYEHLAGKCGKGITLDLHPEIVKNIKKALKAKKGIRLSLDAREIEGNGIGEWFKQAFKDVSKFYKDNLKADLAPLIQKGLDFGTDRLADLASAIPVVGDEAKTAVRKLGRKGTRAIGKQTGAFGIPHAVPSGVFMVPAVWDSRLDIMPFYAPAFNPMVYRGYGAWNSEDRPFVGDDSEGGSFRLAGRGFR